MISCSNFVLIVLKINDTITKNFFLAGHKFMPEKHLKQPEFMYSLCIP